MAVHWVRMLRTGVQVSVSLVWSQWKRLNFKNNLVFSLCTCSFASSALQGNVQTGEIPTPGLQSGQQTSGRSTLMLTEICLICLLMFKALSGGCATHSALPQSSPVTWAIAYIWGILCWFLIVNFPLCKLGSNSHVSIFRANWERQKGPIICISNLWDLANPFCSTVRSSHGLAVPSVSWNCCFMPNCCVAHIGIFHWLLARKPRWTWKRESAFSKENSSLSVFSPFTLVFQLYLPPLAEICICLGQTVFPPLSLLYAAALLLDPQWQWRGTLVFNLFSHSQILCFQVVNLCSPFTACCMLCDWSVHVLSSCWITWNGTGDGLCLWHLWYVS